MSREEAKEIFLNRGFIDGIYDGNKWRDACIVISEWLKEEPRSEWEQDHTILKAYSDGANEVLDKIRAEIEQDAFKDVDGSKFIFVNRVNQIIDKYKGESEG